VSLGFDCRIDTRRITVHGTGELRVITTSNMVDHNRLDQSLPYSRSRLPNRSLAADEVYTVLDRPTSSYIPTLKALEHTHQRMDALQSEVDANTTTYPSALLVSRPKEVDAIQRIEHQHHVANLKDPRKKDVIPNLQTTTLAHFACHGIRHASDPLRSALHLKEWRPQTLCVSLLLKAQLEKLPAGVPQRVRVGSE